MILVIVSFTSLILVGVFALSTNALASRAFGIDQNFRYNHHTGKCVNPEGIEGRSNHFRGVCGAFRDIGLFGWSHPGAMLMGLDASRATSSAEVTIDRPFLPSAT